MAGEFSLYWYGIDGVQIEELRFVSAERAVKQAFALIHPSRPIQRIGWMTRLIITDGGDCTTFEWIKGKGIVFPKGLQKPESGSGTPDGMDASGNLIELKNKGD